jgi:outer membrane protein TolC
MRVLSVAIAMSAVWLGAPRTAWSQSGATALTLGEAIERASRFAPRLAEAEARVTAAREQAAARRADGQPAIVATTGVLRTNHVDEFGVPQAGGLTRILFPDLPTNYRARVEMTVPIYTSGRLTALDRAAGDTVRAASAEREVVSADVRLDTARAYWLLAVARQELAVVTRALARADLLVADVRARVEAGLLPPNELLNAEARRARDDVRRVMAAQDAAIAELQLARLVGEPLGQPIVLLTPMDQADPAAQQAAGDAVDDLLARALAHRAEAEGLTARAASLAAMAEATAAGLRPQVAALAALEPARPNARFVPRTDEWRVSWEAGVSLTWTVFDGGRARAAAAAWSAEAQAVRSRRADLEALVALEVRTRRVELDGARASVGAAARAVAAAREARRVMDDRFRAGVATATDVVEADVALLEAELEAARLDAAVRIQEARLIRALGDR